MSTILLNIVCVPVVAVPIQTTDPLGLDDVPALINVSDRASSCPKEPVPQVITVATGSINPFDVPFTLLSPNPLTP